MQRGQLFGTDKVYKEEISRIYKLQKTSLYVPAEEEVKNY